MTAIIIHGNAAKIVLVLIYLGLAAVGITLLALGHGWAQEKLDEHYEKRKKTDG